MLQACTSDPFSCSNINLTKDTAGYVDPKEGLVYQVETLLTQIGGRPCWELQECVGPDLLCFSTTHTDRALTCLNCPSLTAT
eukprot:SAG31_NODE_548_length_14222_cov_10.926574_8_plen_82_part_00